MTMAPTKNKKGAVRKRFKKCLRRAEALLAVVARQTDTDPTFSDVLEVEV
jgi:hypothetical protein